MSNTQSSNDLSSKAQKAMQANIYGAKITDLTPKEIRSAISGYELRYRIEAIVSGITTKKIKHSYQGSGAFTGNGIMTLPRIPQTHLFLKRDADILLGYTVHEISHQLESDFEMIKNIFKDINNPTKEEMQLKEWWNAIEDYRIEKLTVREYPGFHNLINETRDHTTQQFIDLVDLGMIEPERLKNPYAVGPTALTWIGAQLNGYRTTTSAEALLKIDPELRQWIESVKPRLNLVNTKDDAFNLAKELLDELEQAQEENTDEDQDENKEPSSDASNNKSDEKCDNKSDNSDNKSNKSDDKSDDKSSSAENSSSSENKSDSDDNADDNSGDNSDNDAEDDSSDDSSDNANDDANDSENDNNSENKSKDKSDDKSDKETDDKSDQDDSDKNQSENSKSEKDENSSEDKDPSKDNKNEEGSEKDNESEKSPEENSEPNSEPNSEKSENNNNQSSSENSSSNQSSENQNTSKNEDENSSKNDDQSSKQDQQASSSENKSDINAGNSAPKTTKEQSQAEPDKSDLQIEDIIDAINRLSNEMDSFEAEITSPNSSEPVSIERNQRYYSEIKRTMGASCSRTAGVIRRLLMSQNKTKTRRNIEEGSLDLSRLVPIVNGRRDVYKQQFKKQDVNTAVSILLDNSGSMHGYPITLCQQAAIVIDSAIAQTKTDIEINGFTGSSSCPVIYQYRKFGQKAQSSAATLGSMQEIPMGGTPVSIPILEATLRLKAHKAPRKIMIIISDGAAEDKKRAKEAQDIAVLQGITVIGLGIGVHGKHISGWCDNYHMIQNIEELPNALAIIVHEALKSQNFPKAA